MDLFSGENKIVLFLVAIVVLSPVFVFAQSQNTVCSPTGYTIETINGVFTDETGAKKNSDALKYYLGRTFNGENLDIDYLLNPSHIAGLGDIADSVYQKIFDSETVQDYDLVEMLKSASEKVKTKKLLLVAHSQGNFYANSFYDSVAGREDDITTKAIGVYAVATPSGRVAGGGKWLTSDTDKVISDWVGTVPGRNIMKPNVHIVLGADDDKRGHNFSGVYLKYQSGMIISDIEDSLGKLKYYNNIDDTKGPCIAPPKLTLGHKIEGAALSFIDPAAIGVYRTGLAIGGVVNQTALAIGSVTRQVALALGASVYPVTSAGQTEPNAESTQQSQPPIITAQITDPDIPPTAIESQSEPALPHLGASLPSEVNEPNLEVKPPSTVQADNPAAPRTSFNISPGFGGGGVPVVANDDQQLTDDEVDVSVATDPAICADSSSTNFGGPLPCLYAPEAPPKPAITFPSDFSGPFSTTTIMFIGTSSPGFVISNSLTDVATTTDNSGNWTLTFDNLSEGVTHVNFVATDLAGVSSDPNEVSLNIVLPRPAPPTISSPTFPLQVMNSTSATFIGSTTPGFSVFNDYTNATTTADTLGSWSFSFENLSEGTTTISFYATDMTTNVWPAGLRSRARQTSFNVYNYFPSPANLSIGECANSLAVSGDTSCILPAGQVTLSWDVSSPNYLYFEILKGTTVMGATNYSLLSTTTETSKVIETNEHESSYTFRVRSIDIFGAVQPNANNQVTAYMVHSPPVSITEIAWAGTMASSGDQWVELKNNTGSNIDLSHFTLTSESGLSTPLSGTIDGMGYYIIDLSPDGRALSGISVASTSLPHALSVSGDALNLVFNGGVSTTTIDSTPAIASCNGWCGGSFSDHTTMERKQVETAGSDKNNWLSNDTVTVNGTDRLGTVVNGTPGAQNSVSLGSVGFYCSPYTSSFVDGETYSPDVSQFGYLSCWFLSPGLSGIRVGSLFKGVPGSSAYLDGWYGGGDQGISHMQSLHTNPAYFTEGENFFAVIRELHDAPSPEEKASFDDLFIGQNGVTSPPHPNYGIINWKYRPAI